MGWLCITQLDRGDGVPLLPVDIAGWQRDRVEETMTLLHESARGSFPMRGYPLPLIQAHEHARLGGFEIELYERLLLEQVATRARDVARQAQHLRLLGRQFAEDMSHESVAKV
jgi:NurA-like 5'-3' nuclease